ncbi:MAG: sulfatase [Puniceicoccaceae bacterium]|nr:MAG: sulfatase [Puniceicoccaceae bacterium]
MLAGMAAPRPNILLLVAEDTGRHHGCYGHDYADTPSLDRLAAEGCRYDRAFSHSPVCAPSRSALLTGMHPWTFGTHQMRSTLVKPPRLFTQELQDAGYRVLWPTKTDFNFTPPDGFAETDVPWLDRGELPVGDQPFLAFWNFGVTHESGAWDKVEDKSQDLESRWRDLPPERRHDPARAPVPPYLPDTPGVRLEIARHFDNLTVQDIQVGRALEVLEKSGAADNTIVIYLSDHGRGLCREKRWCYEAGLHLPLIVRWPGRIKPGSVNDDLVAWVDLAPTLLALAGAPVPEHYQGRVFLGPDQAPPPPFVFSGRDRMDEQFDRIRTCRSPRFHYIRNFYPQLPYMQRNRYMESGLTTRDLREGRAAGTLTPAQAAFMADTKPVEELYDTAADPHCVENLAGDSAHHDALRRHRAALEAFLDKHGDLGAVPESELIARGLVTDRLTNEYRPRIAPLPGRFRIGNGDTVLTAEEAVERYGPSPEPPPLPEQ